jgi:hypothetical protein
MISLSTHPNFDDNPERSVRLRAFAQDRQPYGKRERPERLRTAANVMAEPRRVGCEIAPVTGHPHIVPAEHQRSGEQDRGLEQLLAHALGHRTDRTGSGGDTERPQHADNDPPANPKSTLRCATARRHDNADDQRRFEDLSEDDNRGGQHRGRPT